MEVTIYKRPHGRTEVISITNVCPDDAAYFKQQRIRISIEDVGGMFAIYADTGIKNADGEPDELIEMSKGRSCEDTLSALRKLCESREPPCQN